MLFVRLLPNDWSLSLRVAPGVAGDFQGFDAGLLRVSALALGTHAFSDQFVLGGGAIATYGFGSFLPLPAVYLEWKPFPRFQLETFLPAFLSAKYTLGDRVELGLRIDVAGNSYAIRNGRIANVWPCAAGIDNPTTPANEARAEPAQCFDHVAYSVAVAGAVVGVRLFESVWWTASAGHSFFRRFEQLNEDDDRIPGGVQDLPNVFFFRSGFTWRIPRD